MQLLGGVPLVAQTSSPSPESAETANETKPTEEIIPNRTVPSVTQPPQKPQFSATPTDGEILRARVFSEPVLPVGAADAAETAELSRAISAYIDQGGSEQTEPIARFMEAHPMSAWTPSLMLNVGLIFLKHGFFTRASNDFRFAW